MSMSDAEALQFYQLLVSKGIPFSPDNGFISDAGFSLFKPIPDHEAHRLHRINSMAVEAFSEQRIDAWEVATYLKVISYTYMQIKHNMRTLKTQGIFCESQFEYLTGLLSNGGIYVNDLRTVAETKEEIKLRRAEFFMELLVGVHSKNLVVGSHRKSGTTTAQMIPSAIVPQSLHSVMEWAMNTVNGKTDTFDATAEDAKTIFENLCAENMPDPEPDAEENDDDPTRGVY